jgi:hypothetical protein
MSRSTRLRSAGPRPADRRLFLRGLGASIALPMLESGLPREVRAAAAASPPKPPVRMAFLFVPNGVHLPEWKPAACGSAFELPPILQPLAAHRQKLLVLSGLAQDAGFAHGDGPGDHARAAATFLTGVHPVKTDGRGIRAGISVDQVAADALRHATRFASLELGLEAGRNAGGCDSGYSCAYSNNISWRTPTTPSGKEINPRLVFERLFGGGVAVERAQSQAKRDAERRSILDLVQDDARTLQRRLASRDRQKLDEYLTSVREIEVRMERPAGALLDDDAPAAPRGIPADYGQHARLMADLIVLAFRADLTRVATLMMANAGSGLAYPQIGVREGHHNLSHHQNRPENLQRIAQINRYHVEQLAYLLTRLDAVREGEQSLLDNAMIVYGSSLSDGDRHNHDDLPILLAGGGGGRVAGGRHLQFENPTPLMNLYLRMLHVAGIDAERLGDSTGPLPDIAPA